MTTIPRGLLNVKLIEPPCTERYARWCERSANQLMISLLLDCIMVSRRDGFLLFFIFDQGKKNVRERKAQMW